MIDAYTNRIAYLEYALAQRETQITKAYICGAYNMKYEILNRINSVTNSSLRYFFEDLLKDCNAVNNYGAEDIMTEDEFLESLESHSSECKSA